MLTTHATVVDGSLVLEKRVELPDATRVVVSIQQADWQDRLRRGLDAIAAMDVTKLIHSKGERFTRDQLHARD